MTSSTSAPRTWLRTCSPRSATASDASRIASDRARSPSSAVGGGPEQRREHRPPAVGVGRLAVHDGPGEDALGGGRVGEQRRRARDERVGLDPGVDDRAGVAGRVLEPHGRSPMREEDDLRERGQPVDGAMRVLDPADLVDGEVDGRAGLVGGLVGAAVGGDGVEPGPPRVAQVGDVRPLVLDLLAALLEHGVGVEGAVDQVADRLVGHRRSLRCAGARSSSRQPRRRTAGRAGGQAARTGRAGCRGPRLLRWPARSAWRRRSASSSRRARSSQARE